jgi:hypothetical protein
VLEAYLGAAAVGPGGEAAERAVQDLTQAADAAETAREYPEGNR